MAEENIDIEQNEDPIVADQIDPESGKAWEEVAKVQGWRDHDDYTGDPEKWTPAKEFVEKGREVNPILRKNMSSLQDAFDKKSRQYDTDIADLKQSLVRQEVKHQQEMESRELKAVEDGDVDAYKKIQEEKKAAAVETKPVNDFMSDPAVQEFISNNNWYETDRAMTMEAVAYSDELREKAPTLTVEQNLARTEAHIKQEFPHKFEKRKGASPVESGRRVLPKGGKKTYEAMPEASKTACAEAVKEGWVKDRDEFAKTYWSMQS